MPAFFFSISVNSIHDVDIYAGVIQFSVDFVDKSRSGNIEIVPIKGMDVPNLVVTREPEIAPTVYSDQVYRNGEYP
jgi:hypothetical protein